MGVQGDEAEVEALDRVVKEISLLREIAVPAEDLADHSAVVVISGNHIARHGQLGQGCRQ